MLKMAKLQLVGVSSPAHPGANRENASRIRRCLTTHTWYGRIFRVHRSTDHHAEPGQISREEARVCIFLRLTACSKHEHGHDKTSD